MSESGRPPRAPSPELDLRGLSVEDPQMRHQFGWSGREILDGLDNSAGNRDSWRSGSSPNAVAWPLPLPRRREPHTLDSSILLGTKVGANSPCLTGPGRTHPTVRRTEPLLTGLGRTGWTIRGLVPGARRDGRLGRHAPTSAPILEEHAREDGDVDLAHGALADRPGPDPLQDQGYWMSLVALVGADSRASRAAATSSA